MNRRELLARGTLAATALHLSQPSVLAPARKRDIKLALKFGMIRGGDDLSAKFQIAREAGFQGVELDSPGDLTAEKVLEAKRSSGLEVPGVVDSVHWNQTLGDADAAVRAKGRAALEQALRDAKAWGASTVLLVPAVVSERIAYDQAWTNSQAEVRAVLPLAAELGVKIAFENVWNHFLLSPLEAARYVDEFQSPWVGWFLDVGNLVNYGWPEQWARILGKRVLKLDVKGFSRAKRDKEGLWKGFDAPIGEDDCGWPAVMRALDEVGFTGWASAEVGGGDVKHLRGVAERMERVLQSA
jgi:hexulose-6-phosphate isomerase